MDRKLRDKQRAAYLTPEDTNSLWAYIACLERMSGAGYTHGPDKRIGERFRLKDYEELIGEKIEKYYSKARKPGRNGLYTLHIKGPIVERPDIPISLVLEQKPDDPALLPSKVVYPEKIKGRPQIARNSSEVRSVSRLMLQSNLMLPQSPATWFNLYEVLNQKRF